MNRKDIQKSIIKAVDSYFVGKANGARIKEIEYQLGVVLPDSYKWFLMEFGHGGVSGFEIFGNGLERVMNFEPSMVNSRHGTKNLSERCE